MANKGDISEVTPLKLPVGLRPTSRNGALLQRIGRNGDRGRTRSPCLLPRLRLDPTGFMGGKMNIALRKRALSPVRLVLEDSPMRSFIFFGTGPEGPELEG